MTCNLTKGERLVFVHMPILVAGLLIATFYGGTAADWSGTKAFLVGMLVCAVYTAFVVCPLLILVSQPKKTHE